MRKALLLFTLFATLASLSRAQGIIRGPYLQMPTSASIIVRWRTDSLTVTDSRVNYGADTANLSAFAEDTALTTEHSVKITGLSPFTKYYYSVGSSSQVMSGPDGWHHFTTSPVPGTVQPVRVWAIGDFGKGNIGEGLVRDSYFYSYSAGKHTDVWLWLGDNVYYSGTDDEYQQKVFTGPNGYGEVLKSLPFMPAPGNHDYEVISKPPGDLVPPLSHTGPYYDIIDVPANGEAGGVASNTELYYSFDYANIHFISINSELGSTTPAYDWTGATSGNNFNSSPFKQWLESDLQANDKRWVIAYWHQPPYSKCKQVDSDDFWQFYVIAMRNNIVPLLEQYGVDMVVCGHGHVFHRSYLINGHYGLSSSFSDSMKVNGGSGKLSQGEPYYKYTQGPLANKGTVYVMEGNSGSDDSLLAQHPAIYFAHGGTDLFGSFIVDVNADTLTGRYLTSAGEFLDDFTIIKVVDVAPSVQEAPALLSDMRVFPNPFSGKTSIEYTLSARCRMSVEIYDIGGKRVYTFIDSEQEAGSHRYELDAAKAGLAKATYLLRIISGSRLSLEKPINIE